MNLQITNYKNYKLFLIETDIQKIDKNKINKLISNYSNISKILIHNNTKYWCEYKVNNYIYNGYLNNLKEQK